MHCPSCGSVLAADPPITCETCGAQIWADAKPCACALVTKEDGQLLLIKRASEPWKGYWDIPGGFCNPSEHPIAAAERETLEETGLSVRVTSFVGIWLARYDDPATDKLPKETMDIFYEADLVGSERADPDPAEVKELRWFSSEELPSNIAFPEAQLPVLEIWKRRESGTSGSPLPDRPRSSARTPRT
jgi:8-oxo-dGTP diphosphatase